MIATRPKSKQSAAPKTRQPAVIKTAQIPAVKQTARVEQPLSPLEADPRLLPFKKLIDFHNETNMDFPNEKSAISMICEFNPESLDRKKAEDLAALGVKLKRAENAIIKIVAEFEQKPDASPTEKIKMDQLKLIGIDLKSFTDWIDDKHKAYEDFLYKKITAFRKIYKALFDGESGLFKSNFMAGRDWYEDVNLNDEIIKDNDERTRFAYSLAHKYPGENCRWDNDQLFTEIYKYAFNHSGFFSRSCLLGQTIFSRSAINSYSLIRARADYMEANPHSRTARICHALGYQKAASIGQKISKTEPKP